MAKKVKDNDKMDFEMMRFLARRKRDRERREMLELENPEKFFERDAKRDALIEESIQIYQSHSDQVQEILLGMAVDYVPILKMTGFEIETTKNSIHNLLQIIVDVVYSNYTLIQVEDRKIGSKFSYLLTRGRYYRFPLDLYFLIDFENPLELRSWAKIGVIRNGGQFVYSGMYPFEPLDMGLEKPSYLNMSFHTILYFEKIKNLARKKRYNANIFINLLPLKIEEDEQGYYFSIKSE